MAKKAKNETTQSSQPTAQEQANNAAKVQPGQVQNAGHVTPGQAQSDAAKAAAAAAKNAAPTAHDDIATAHEDGPEVRIDVLANDTDPDGGDTFSTLRVIDASASSGADVVVDGTAGAAITYRPATTDAFEGLATGETAVDTITYTIEDAAGAQSTATVEVTVVGTNDAPVIDIDVPHVIVPVDTTEGPASGGMMSFDGRDIIDAGRGVGDSLAITGDLTLEAWINPHGPGTSPGGQGGIIINKEWSYEIARFSDGTINYALQGADAAPWQWVDTGFVAPLDSWTHVALVYDQTSATVNVYGNGALVHSAAGPAALHANTNPVFLGGRLSHPGKQNLQAYMDDVRAWQSARSADEIAANYDRTLAGDEAGLVSNWRFDAVGDVIVDSGPMGNDATNVGAYQLDSDAPITAASADGDAHATITGLRVFDAEADVAPDAEIFVTLSVGQGSISLGSDAALTSVTGDGTATVAGTGSLDAVNGALDALSYTPDAGFSGTDTLTVMADDQAGGIADPLSVPLFVAPKGQIFAGDELDNTLLGTADADILTGLAGNDTLEGLAGDDILRGGDGDDVLVGGAGADRFVFAEDGGHDTIADFVPGQDRIDLADFGLQDFAEIAKSVGVKAGDTYIDLGDGNGVTVTGVRADELNDSDFVI